MNHSDVIIIIIIIIIIIVFIFKLLNVKELYKVFQKNRTNFGSCEPLAVKLFLQQNVQQRLGQPSAIKAKFM